MPDKDVVLAKVASIQKCLEQFYTTILTHFQMVNGKA